jgi:hypothetical protein
VLCKDDRGDLLEVRPPDLPKAFTRRLPWAGRPALKMRILSKKEVVSPALLMLSCHAEEKNRAIYPELALSNAS